jgi:hypothetical protein
MHLDREATTVTRTGSSGETIKEEQVSQRSQAAPEQGLSPSEHVIDIVRTGADGVRQESQTIEGADPNGGMRVVWVDTTKVTPQGSPSVVVDTKGAAQKPASPPRK